MTIYPADHPLWKLLHAVVFLIGSAWFAYHGADLDGGGAGAVGVAAGTRAVWLHFFAKG